MSEPIRIALCDDHALVRSGLRRILDAEPDLEVVAEAGTAAEAEQVAAALRPDVFVMDLRLPDVGGIEATRAVRRVSGNTHVLVLTVHDDVGYLRQAFAAGATGYLVKDAAAVELVLAVRAVREGRPYVYPGLGAALLAPDGPEPGGRADSGLTEREREVLRLIALGHTNAEVAEALFLSVRTVETHRAHISQKLGARTRADLVAAARAAGLLSALEVTGS